jgi:aryl carrier-like protein
MMTIRETIASLFKDVAREAVKDLAPLRDNLPLIGSGLDSLCLAVIIARLDDLGLDPFGIDEVTMPTTFGQFVALYERAAAAA